MQIVLRCSAALLLITTGFSQPASSTIWSTVGDDLSLFLKLTGHTLAAPTRWDGDDWLTAGVLVGSTGGTGLLDDDIFRLMERNQRTANTSVSNVTADYGSGITGVALTGGMYIAGLAWENKWLRETSVLIASALSVSVVVELPLKFVVGRARPYTGLGHGAFTPFNGRRDFLSFPSGHTVVAFTLSTVLSERIKNTWVSIGLYMLATSVAVSRMYSRDHWFSDVVFAGALSIVVGRSVVKWYEGGMKEDECSMGIHVIPHTTGVMVVWRF